MRRRSVPQEMLPRHVFVESLEQRCLCASSHPIAVNFNDEALWGANFTTAVAQAKALGVTAVRLWYGFDYYDARPNAWDTIPSFTNPGGHAGDIPEVDPDALVMKRAFQLHEMGFSVMLVVQQNQGIPPNSPTQVRRMIDYLMTSTETPTSTATLTSAVDYWEIGNEPDTANYWQPSGVNKTVGLKSYVDNFLIPAAQELHAHLATPEQVVSAGVSYDPADLKTILNELAAQHAMADIDFAGFHAYGTYDPTNPINTGTLQANAALAVRYATAYGKQVMATEWNVRGYDNSGAQNAIWAQAIDSAYKNVILPSFDIGYYFALINNWPARGGTTSARPGGLLTHAFSGSVSSYSSLSALANYYDSPLVPSNVFYNTFDAWQFSTVSGVITPQSQTAANSLASTRVYIDLNDDGKFDAGEPSVFAAANGSYALKFSVRTVTPGSYDIRVAASAALVQTSSSVQLSLTNLINTTNVDFTVAAPAKLAGRLWNDVNGDGLFNGTDTYAASRVVFIDMNDDGILDAGDLQTVTDAEGRYSFSGLRPGDYRVSHPLPAGYRLSDSSMPYLSVRLTSGEITSLDIGVTTARAA